MPERIGWYNQVDDRCDVLHRWAWSCYQLYKACQWSADKEHDHDSAGYQRGEQGAAQGCESQQDERADFKHTKRSKRVIRKVSCPPENNSQEGKKYHGSVCA